MSTQNPSVTWLPPNYQVDHEQDEQRRQGNLYAFRAGTSNDAQLADRRLADLGRAGGLAHHRPGGLAASRFGHIGFELVFERGHHLPAAAAHNHAVALADALTDKVPVAVPFFVVAVPLVPVAQRLGDRTDVITQSVQGNAQPHSVGGRVGVGVRVGLAIRIGLPFGVSFCFVVADVGLGDDFRLARRLRHGEPEPDRAGQL